MNLYNYYDPYGRPLPGVPLPPPLLRARALEQQAHAHALAFAAPQAGALHARPPLPPPQGPPGATGARLRKRASAAGAWPAGAGAMWTPARAQMPRLASRAATLGAPARPRRPSRRGWSKRRPRPRGPQGGAGAGWRRGHWSRGGWPLPGAAWRALRWSRRVWQSLGSIGGLCVWIHFVRGSRPLGRYAMPSARGPKG